MKSTYASSRRSPAGRAAALVVMVTMIMFVLALMNACGGTSDTDTTAASPSLTGGGGAQVSMKDIAFDPDSVTIKVGETVTWTNEESVPHTVVGDNGEFESADLANGDTFTFTFNQAGTYAYHCSIHPGMKGTVVVQ
jgi:amicyanin